MNGKISQEIKQFFAEYGISVDDLFPENSDIILEGVDRQDIREILSTLSKIEGSNNAHKILFAAGLLELRHQVKSNQSQIAELNKQLERNLKELNQKIDDHEKENKFRDQNLNTKLDTMIRLFEFANRKSTIS